jgi:hypothetical protein
VRIVRAVALNMEHYEGEKDAEQLVRMVLANVTVKLRAGEGRAGTEWVMHEETEVAAAQVRPWSRSCVGLSLCAV